MCLVSLYSMLLSSFVLSLKLIPKLSREKRKLSFFRNWFRFHHGFNNIHKKNEISFSQQLSNDLSFTKLSSLSFYVLATCYWFWYWYCLYLLRRIVKIVIFRTIHTIWFRLFFLISFQKSFANSIYCSNWFNIDFFCMSETYS
jgi:hypothetical protein